MAILALDIATTTGWALLDKRAPDRPYLGSIRFPSDPQQIGRAAESMRQFLEERHKMHGGLTDIIFEAQHVGGKIDINVIQRLIGLGAIVEWVAHCIGARCYVVHIGTWRKHAFGTGRLTRQEAKTRAMEECRRLGFDPQNDNEAEALLILDYYLHLKAQADKSVRLPWREASFFTNELARR